VQRFIARNPFPHGNFYVIFVMRKTMRKGHHEKRHFADWYPILTPDHRRASATYPLDMQLQRSLPDIKIEQQSTKASFSWHPKHNLRRHDYAYRIGTLQHQAPCF